MNITILTYDGKVYHINCESFEFRTNHVTNWIKIKYQDGNKSNKEIINEVATIKAEN